MGTQSVQYLVKVFVRGEQRYSTSRLSSVNNTATPASTLPTTREMSIIRLTGRITCRVPKSSEYNKRQLWVELKLSRLRSWYENQKSFGTDNLFS